jgi:ATP-dependent protease ClpP protease subunit
MYQSVMQMSRRQLLSGLTTSLLSSSYCSIKMPYSSSSSENESNIETCNYSCSGTSIRFYGDITTESCIILQDLIKIAQINSKTIQEGCKLQEPTPQGVNLVESQIPIHLHIQSRGGVLLDSFYILDTIINSDVPIYSYVDGYCASAASLISIVAQKRFMSKHSFILLHQLSSQVNSNKFDDIEDEVVNLNTFMKTMREIYLEHTNISAEELENILHKDIWLDATQCLNYGLVDKLI